MDVYVAIAVHGSGQPKGTFNPAELFITLVLPLGVMCIHEGIHGIDEIVRRGPVTPCSRHTARGRLLPHPYAVCRLDPDNSTPRPITAPSGVSTPRPHPELKLQLCPERQKSMSGAEPMRREKEPNPSRYAPAPTRITTDKVTTSPRR
jgi:hypothetical protein